jgi:nucleoside-diphosphate-sugar epimerase
MKYQEEENSLSKLENSQKIKILITGGSGFIGSRLLRNLITKKIHWKIHIKSDA